MHDQRVKFETANLAKEVGFDLKVDAYYNHAEQESYIVVGKGNWNFSRHGDIVLSAPTQSLLQRWIREKYLIHIEVYSFIDGTWGGDLIHKDAPYEYDDKNAPYDVKGCKEYEDALEICLQKALKKIKDEHVPL